MNTQSITAAPIDLDASPAQVVGGLAHLPGLVFLDSSSSEVVDAPHEQTIAMVSARPTQIVKGNIKHQKSRDRLKSILAENQHSGMDLGFPLGGLVGWFEYNGDFVFGVYSEMLIYDYSSEQWFEVGELSDQIQDNGSVEVPSFGDYTNSWDEADFCSAVKKVKDYIASGDIYQVNLSHRFQTECTASIAELLALYLKIRYISPAPYSSFLHLDDRTVLSTSPEQFLRISDRTIETRPIKGTRPRFPDHERDEKSAYDLITSDKEISELIMITDLERNDLGQICEFGSIETTELLKLERFAQVFHLVSTVQGRLREEVDHVEALHACFPGGSITGAPKKRAREIIDELESVPRGLYTGSIGCFGFNGESRFNIAIRTAVCQQNRFQFHVGAGIVADSVPELEWLETWHKAAGLLLATSS